MELKIYIDRLKDGHIEKFAGHMSARFLDVSKDDELSFPDNVALTGESYLANDHLIVRLHIETKAFLPCSICNQAVEIPIVVPDFYHAEPLDQIKSSVFDFSDFLREDIFLQVPQFIECHQGKCPERDSIKKYLKDAPEKSRSPADKAASSGHFQFPFSDLETQ